MISFRRVLNTFTGTVRPTHATGGCSPLSMNGQWIGRSGAGKTTLDTALRTCTIGHPLQSGLLFTTPVDDPASAIRQLNRTRERVTDLQTRGMTTTLAATPETWLLQEGEDCRVQITINECVGQALTNPDGSGAFAEQFRKHQQLLGCSDFIMVCIRTPQDVTTPDDGAEYDTHVADALLRAALKRHQVSQQPVVVSILLTQVDSAFSNPEEARYALNDSALNHWLRPLINTIHQSSVVRAAAVIPVSAFGFQKTADATDVRAAAADAPVDPRRIPAGVMKSTSLLAKDQKLQPWNLQALLPWIVLQTMLSRQVTLKDGQAAVMKRIVIKLRDDLGKLNPWLSVIR